MNDHVVVFKDKQSRQIHTYVNCDEIGATINLTDFLSLLSDFYGNPAATMTKKGHLARLQEACDKVIYHMKSQTKEVAAINLPK